MTTPRPSTPCIGICRVERGHCVGCLRTLAEIAAWGGLSEPERLLIIQEVLPARQSSMEAKKMQEDATEIGEENV